MRARFSSHPTEVGDGPHRDSRAGAQLINIAGILHTYVHDEEVWCRSHAPCVVRPHLYACTIKKVERGGGTVAAAAVQMY